MSQNWVANLDLLASAGVIDYDGAAFLRNSPPRYIDNPAFRTNPQPLPPTGVSAKAPLGSDTFSTSASKPLADNPGWKKLLFTFLAGGLLMYGGVRFKGAKPVKWLGGKCTDCWHWLKKPFTKKT